MPLLYLWLGSPVTLYCQDYPEPRLQPNLLHKSSDSTSLEHMSHPLPHLCEITNTNSLTSLPSPRVSGSETEGHSK